jgi:hypothetical protein
MAYSEKEKYLIEMLLNMKCCGNCLNSKSIECKEGKIFDMVCEAWQYDNKTHEERMI